MEIMPEAVALPVRIAPRRESTHPVRQFSDLLPDRTSSLRRSMGVVTLAWVFGSVWYNTTTGEPLTVFAKQLGASNFQFGLLTALPFIASLMSLPGSLLIESTGQRKRIFLWGFTIQRSLWFVIPLVPLWIASRFGMGGGGKALSIFFALTFLMYAAGAVGGPGWLSWMADLVPSRLNGKYFSRRRQWGILTAVPAAIFVGWILDRCPNDSLTVLRWCAVIFLCCAVFGLADIHLFQLVPCIPRQRQTGQQLLRGLREPLASPTFLCCSMFVGMLTFAVNFTGQFATLFLLDEVKVTNLSAQMILLVAPMLGQLLLLGLWGRAADRMGKRPLLVIASVTLIPVGAAWCLVNPGRVWLAYLLSGLGAALWSGVEVANLNLVLEASGSKDPSQKTGRQGGSSYAAINSVIINIAGCLGGLAAGLIAQILRNWHWQPAPWCKNLNFYDVLFITSAVLRVGSVALFLPLLHEPASRPVRETVRFMLATANPIKMLNGRPHVQPATLAIIACHPDVEATQPPLRKCA